MRRILWCDGVVGVLVEIVDVLTITDVVLVVTAAAAVVIVGVMRVGSVRKSQFLDGLGKEADVMIETHRGESGGLTRRPPKWELW